MRIWEWDMKEHKVLEGTYNGQFQGIGEFHSTVFHIRQKGTNRIQTIWGTYIIKLNLTHMKIGSHVRIEYMGDKFMEGRVGKTGKKKKFHDFKITSKSEKIPMGKLDGRRKRI